MVQFVFSELFPWTSYHLVYTHSLSRSSFSHSLIIQTTKECACRCISLPSKSLFIHEQFQTPYPLNYHGVLAIWNYYVVVCLKNSFSSLSIRSFHHDYFVGKNNWLGQQKRHFGLYWSLTLKSNTSLFLFKLGAISVCILTYYVHSSKCDHSHFIVIFWLNIWPCEKNDRNPSNWIHF